MCKGGEKDKSMSSHLCVVPQGKRFFEGIKASKNGALQYFA
jgi:hypothetical protein